ncbi:hypothetical protein LCGC14_0387040 [marine sediment metagenome]|uniref:Uncharacterized protein n=1 Tax=marine sediment metagenome TaxID=412755 RepID=A0A0F9VMY1_9ZZZZ
MTLIIILSVISLALSVMFAVALAAYLCERNAHAETLHRYKTAVEEWGNTLDEIESAWAAIEAVADQYDTQKADLAKQNWRWN